MKLQKPLIATLSILLPLIVLSCAQDQNSGRFVPQKPKLTGNALTDLRDYGDLMRSEYVAGTSTPDIDKLLNDPALTAVTREFGPSVIPNQKLPFKSALAASQDKPWSSWWFPKREDTLFSDARGRRTAALTKYDFIRLKYFEQTERGQPPNSAAEFERKNHNPNAITWEGLCDAWSLASISQPEPKHPVTVTVGGDSVTFSVGELKALLLKTYEAVDDAGLKYYGQKFTGDYNGWIYPDVFPDQFHRFIEIQLFKNKQAFVMDHDAGIEVWNIPVYKTNYVMNSVPNDPNAVFVRTWLYTAEPVQPGEKDFVGTKEAVREYDYVLQGKRNVNGDLEVTSGYWVKGPDGVDSRKDHPDYLIRIADPAKLVRKSWNPEIDVELVDSILARSH